MVRKWKKYEVKKKEEDGEFAHWKKRQNSGAF